MPPIGDPRRDGYDGAMIRAFALPALLLLAACHAGREDPVIEHAWVRLPAVAGRPAAAYFTISGSDGAADRLVKVESALVQKIELHESMAGMGGMMAMKPLASVVVPASQTVVFKPGDRHAMLFGIDPVVKPGTAVPLRFGFASGKTAEAEAKTVGAGDDAPY